VQRGQILGGSIEMASSYMKTMRTVFSNRNILGIALTTSLITLTDMGWRPFWGLYLKNELGASIAAVGLLSMIQNSERLLFQLSGGTWLTSGVGGRSSSSGLPFG